MDNTKKKEVYKFLRKVIHKHPYFENYQIHKNDIKSTIISKSLKKSQQLSSQITLNFVKSTFDYANYFSQENIKSIYNKHLTILHKFYSNKIDEQQAIQEIGIAINQLEISNIEKELFTKNIISQKFLYPMNPLWKKLELYSKNQINCHHKIFQKTIRHTSKSCSYCQNCSICKKSQKCRKCGKCRKCKCSECIGCKKCNTHGCIKCKKCKKCILDAAYYCKCGLQCMCYQCKKYKNNNNMNNDQILSQSQNEIPSHSQNEIPSHSQNDIPSHSQNEIPSHSQNEIASQNNINNDIQILSQSQNNVNNEIPSHSQNDVNMNHQNNINEIPSHSQNDIPSHSQNDVNMNHQNNINEIPSHSQNDDISMNTDKAIIEENVILRIRDVRYGICKDAAELDTSSNTDVMTNLT